MAALRGGRPGSRPRRAHSRTSRPNRCSPPRRDRPGRLLAAGERCGRSRAGGRDGALAGRAAGGDDGRRCRRTSRPGRRWTATTCGLLRLWAERSLRTAKSAVPSDLDSSFEVTEASSIAAGLADAAARHHVSMVVLGSSAKGLTGRITLGSVIDALTHGSQWPLALAPRGYRAAEDERIDRLTVLFSHAGAIDRLLAPARDLAQRLDVSTRFASFLVRPLRREAGLDRAVRGRPRRRRLGGPDAPPPVCAGAGASRRGASPRSGSWWATGSPGPRPSATCRGARATWP